MSICHATEYDIQIFSRNKLCSFYVVKDTDTEKYHVFVVVFPEKNVYDRRGYILSSHDKADDALIQKDIYVEKFNGVHVYD